MSTLLTHFGESPVIRGGLFKMRTHPQSFQGLREAGLELVKELKELHSFEFVTEVSTPEQIEMVAPAVSAFQVGTRSMYNYELLRELNKYKKPVILKRAFSATLDEWIGASEYLSKIQDMVILCERGIRGFDPKLRNVLDLGSVTYLKDQTDFKIIVDPSHALGKREYVAKLCYAAMAAGADGLLIEVHPDPMRALSDPDQAIDLQTYAELTKTLSKLAAIFNREVL